jgi:glycosidase
VYNNLVFDYLYPDPSSVMAFIENHDTDRFLKDGQDADKLKQALALLLTMNRIPQLYYGTEILMNGTKAVTDGNVRKDFPGGFPGDEHNCFTAEGRNKEQNEMYDWLRSLLHWRNGAGKDLITKGKQIQFLPNNGFYVLARQLGNHAVLTIVNGTSDSQIFNTRRYDEIIGNHTYGVEVTNGFKISLTNILAVPARQTLILELLP